MDTRLIKQNENCLKYYNQKMLKQMEWSSLKRKNDLLEKKKL